MSPSNSTSADRRTYHHGDLRRAVLSAALDVIAAEGPGALSLRDLARRAGVSHAAPAHH
ncbi:TetR/AcrR family transcriptional regulator, partial [Streptomyces recifensis]